MALRAAKRTSGMMAQAIDKRVVRRQKRWCHAPARSAPPMLCRRPCAATRRWSHRGTERDRANNEPTPTEESHANNPKRGRHRA